MPFFPAPGKPDKVKTSAAWLLEKMSL